MPQRPNILYLTGDCFKASAFRLFAGQLFPQSFMGRMAASGISFADTYAQNSICTPSRATVFTGVHPLVHQVTCHQHRAPVNLPQLSELLRESGYYTAVVGHYESNRDLGRGWVEQVDEAAPGRLRSSYQAWQSSGRRDVGWTCGTLPLPAEESNSHLLTDRAVLMLDSIEALGAPFFLHVSYNDPHSPCFAPPPYDTLVDPADVPLLPVGEPGPRPAWHEDALEVFRTSEATEADLRAFYATYLGMVAHLDRQMERLVEAIDRRGMLGNTWIVIGSDHGDYTGEKGMFSHTESLYECLLHVPLIIRPPEGLRAPRGQEVTGFVELVDLFPTFLGLAGIDAPNYAQGHDLVAWVGGGAGEPLRDCTFAQVGDYHGRLGDTLPGGRPKCTRHPGLLQGVRTAEFSFTRDPDFGDEAYDLRADPHELVNLLNDATESGEVGELRGRVDAWEAECLALRDKLGVIPGYRGFDEGWE